MENLKALSVSQIKEWLESSTLQVDESVLNKLKEDSRASVQQLAKKWERLLAKKEQEGKRLEKLKLIEKDLRSKGFNLIAGIDEAGRGPLAGPVCVASCILPEDWDLPGLNDSKKIPKKRRNELAEEIKKQAIAYKILLTSAEEVDRLNILQVTLRTAYKTIRQLSRQPDFVLTDALKLPDLGMPHRAIDQGDAKSSSIAAASILAKTTRDELLLKLDEEFPQYGFASHKGYGSQSHCEALVTHGPSTIHRLSFGKVVLKPNRSLVHSKSFHQFLAEFQAGKTLADLEEIGRKVQQKKKLLPKRELDGLRQIYLACKENLTDADS